MKEPQLSLTKLLNQVILIRLMEQKKQKKQLLKLKNNPILKQVLNQMVMILLLKR